MIGLGTLVNTGAILAGGILGFLFGKLLKERHQETLSVACGISTLFIAMSGALKYMLPGQEESLRAGGSMLIIFCLTLGGLIGEALNIEKKFEQFGEWLKRKSGNGNDSRFVDGFVTASLTVCIGAMAIVGSIQDGLTGDWSTLGAKSVLDLIIIMVMTSAWGKGCVFSAIPVFILEGGMTLLASLIKPLMTERSLAFLSLIGSVLIFCVGINLVWGKKVRVANLLPSLILAVGFAFLPITF